MYVYLCVYICMYMHISTHIYVYVCISIYVHLWSFTHTVGMYRHAYMCIYAYPCIYTLTVWYKQNTYIRLFLARARACSFNFSLSLSFWSLSLSFCSFIYIYLHARTRIAKERGGVQEHAQECVGQTTSMLEASTESALFKLRDAMRSVRGGAVFGGGVFVCTTWFWKQRRVSRARVLCVIAFHMCVHTWFIFVECILDHCDMTQT